MKLELFDVLYVMDIALNANSTFFNRASIFLFQILLNSVSEIYQFCFFLACKWYVNLINEERAGKRENENS